MESTIDQNGWRARPLPLILVSALGLSLFQASAWVMFLSPSFPEEPLANSFAAASPFFLSLLGQTVAVLLSLSRFVRARLLSVFSHPAVFLLCAALAGAGAALSASADTFIASSFSLALMGFAGAPLLFAWGTFFSGQQPHYAAVAVAVSFIVNCLLSSLFALADGIGLQLANLLLPVCSVLVWLFCIKHFEPAEKGGTNPIRTHFDDGTELGIHRNYLSASFASAQLLIGQNRSLLIFSASVFFIYLFEQLLVPLGLFSDAVFLKTTATACVIFVIFWLYGIAAKRRNPDLLWPLFVLLVFAALFAVVLFWPSAPAQVSDAIIVVARSMQILTWTILVTTISRHSLEPFRAFGLGYFMSQELPWLLSFGLSVAVMEGYPRYGDHMVVIAGGATFLLLVSFTLVFALFYARDQKVSIALDRGLGLAGQADSRDEGAAVGAMPKRFLRSLENIVAAAGLTSREAEIIKLIIQGRTLPEIAERNFISINTVRTHYRNAYKKLNIHKKSELIDLFERDYDWEDSEG